MHFSMKSYLKSNRNHTAKYSLNLLACMEKVLLPQTATVNFQAGWLYFKLFHA